MNWLLLATQWCDQQLPFLAVLNLFLFLALGLSLVSAIIGLRGQVKVGTVLSFSLLTYLIIDGARYIEYSVPFLRVSSEAMGRAYLNIIQAVAYTALTGVVLALWSTFKAINLNRRLVLMGLVFTGLVAVVFLVLPRDAIAILKAYKLLLLWALGGGLWIFARSHQDRRSTLLKRMAACVIGYALFDWIAWGGAGVAVDGWSLVRVLCGLSGVGILMGVIATVDALFVHEISPYAARRPMARMMAISQWVCLIVLILAAWQISSNLIQRYYDNLITSTINDAQVLKDRIMAWREQNLNFVSTLSGSPSIEQLVDSTGEHNIAKATEVLSRYGEGVHGGTFYIMDNEGNCIASSNYREPTSYVGHNFGFREYFKRPMRGKPYAQFSKGVITGEPGVFAGCPIYDHKTNKIVGVAAMKKTLYIQLFFTEYPYAFFFDKGGKVLICTRDRFANYAKSDFEKNIDIPAAIVHAHMEGANLVMQDKEFFLFRSEAVDNEGSTVAVLHDASSLFFYRAGVYVTAVAVLLFVVVVFCFTRIVVLRTNRELEQSAEFKTILDCSPNCIFLVGADFKCNQLKGLGASFLGKASEDFLKQPFMELWQPGQQSMVLANLKRVLRGDRVSFDANYEHPDGHVMTFFVVCGPLYAVDGSIDQIVAVFVDITHHKRIERELLARLDIEKTLSHITSEFIERDQAHVALQNSLDHILTVGQVDRINWFENIKTSTGEAAAQLMYISPKDSYANQESVGFVQGYAGAFEPWQKDLKAGKCVALYEDSKDLWQSGYCKDRALRSALLVPFRTEGRWSGFARFDACGEKILWTREKIGQLTSLCDALQDAWGRTSTQRTLKLLSAAVRSAEEGMVITEVMPNSDWPKIIFVNRAMAKISGYTEAELLGNDPRVLGDKGSNSAEFITRLRSQLVALSVFRTEMTNKRKDGSEYLADLSIYPIVNAKGEVTHYLSIQRDITQQRELQNRSSLSSKLESIGQLAAGIAHEINTPTQFISDNLFFIKDNWEVLSSEVLAMESQLPEAKRKKIKYIVGEMPQAIADGLEGIERISTIVKAMREFSHSSGDKARADINKAIETTITVARNEWKYVSEIKTELDPSLPVLTCYIGDLNQVVLNMIVNSSHTIKDKFEKLNQKGLITIRTAHNEKEIVIEVEDNGMGIPESARAKIYDPFFTTKEVGKGTGQGLFIAHRVVTERHGGTIDFVTEIGKGTKFIIKLPLDVPAAS